MSRGLKAREPRQKVMIPARMRAGEAYIDVCIRNISSRGMMLQAATPPPPGTYIEILRAAHVIVGRIVWTNDRRFGIHTSDRLNIASIVNQTQKSTVRSPNEERRAAPRPSIQRLPDAAEQLERSRRLSRMFEFGTVVVCGIGGAGLIAHLAYGVMARPFEVAARYLS